MSFILDALRKSETDRQRKSAPGLVDAGLRPPARRRGIWLPVLIVVLVANLALMSVLWLRRNGMPTAGARSEAAEPPPAATATVPAPVGGDLAAVAGVSTPDPEFGATADMPAMEEEPVSDSLPLPGAGDGGQGARFVHDDLPTAEQLMAGGAIPTQTLHLDIHVYSTTPAERFVFINMRKYAEGAELPEGAKVEEITRDGVVLSQAGQRFVLSRD